MTFLLIKEGHGDASVVLCTGHSDSDTLFWYRNLQGREGWNQEVNIFNDFPNFEQPCSDQASFVKKGNLAIDNVVSASCAGPDNRNQIARSAQPPHNFFETYNFLSSLIKPTFI